MDVWASGHVRGFRVPCSVLCSLGIVKGGEERRGGSERERERKKEYVHKHPPFSSQTPIASSVVFEALVPPVNRGASSK